MLYQQIWNERTLAPVGEWILGVLVLLICIYFMSLIHSLKVLLFDKSLTAAEKKELKSDLKPLLLVPVILGVTLVFSKRAFIAAVILLGIMALLSVLLSSWKKNRKPNKKDGVMDVLSDGGDVADGLF